MSKKILVFLFLMVFLAGSVLAVDWPVCIDNKNPSAPSSLKVLDNFKLSWAASTDEPKPTKDCAFGIDHYNIYLNGRFFDSTSAVSYSGDKLPDGNYLIEVSAVDKANNEGERARKEIKFPLSSSSGSSGGSGGGSGGGGGGGSPTTTNGNSEKKGPVGEDMGGSTGKNKREEKSSGKEGDSSFGITGAVTGVFGKSSYLLLGFLFLIVLVIAIVLYRKR